MSGKAVWTFNLGVCVMCVQNRIFWTSTLCSACQLEQIYTQIKKIEHGNFYFPVKPPIEDHLKTAYTLFFLY